MSILIRKPTYDDLLSCDKLATLCFENTTDCRDEPLDFDKQTPQSYGEKMKARAADNTQRCCTNPLERYVAFDGDEAVAQVSRTPLSMRFDGNNVSCSGIGYVCTSPPYRRRGLIEQIMRRHLEDMTAEGVVLSHLYPFSERFYGMFGYALSRPLIAVTFDTSFINVDKEKWQGTFELFEGTNLEGFEQAYAAMPHYNLSLQRTSPDFLKLKDAQPWKNSKFGYLFRDNGGKPRGYLVFSKKNIDGQSTLDCDEFIFDNSDTFKALLKFVKTFASDYPRTKLLLPRELSEARIVTDTVAANYKRESLTSGMTRVVSPLAVLQKARYIGSGSITIRITDKFLDKEYNISAEYTSGQATRVTNSDLPPDVTFDIAGFSQAITGVYDADTLEFLGYEGAAKYPSVFYKKPTFLSDYF
ncbi:MAG: GNAT family N-acetyltransferase [Oscillospiraceae bacterium]|jgi:predicted acetyltransferase|nr:GNAT family N-acetyltransferase [Oscillospiraceae bacterium]